MDERKTDGPEFFARAACLVPTHIEEDGPFSTMRDAANAARRLKTRLVREGIEPSSIESYGYEYPA